MAFVLDMGYLDNPLWNGVKAEQNDGKFNLPATQETINRLKQNARKLASETQEKEVRLTGGAPVWAYMAVATAIGNTFDQVHYFDGRSTTLTIASKL